MKKLLSILIIWAPIASLMAGTFANITIDGDISDWASITPIITDANEGFDFDINQISIANNATDVFFLISYNNNSGLINPQAAPGLFLGIDNDSNLATGFDVYSQGIIGTEGAYQNDFPFEQATGTFNTGATPNAPILISPYNVNTTFQEFSISRSAIIDTVNSQALFPNNSFDFIAYFNDTDSDVSGVASYTFAIPEPSSVVLTLSGIAALIVFGRLRRK